MEKQEDPRLLAGSQVADDAVVVRLTDQVVLVQTVDFFTPVVDSPYHFGRIAAANSLSDVYAMGGRPVTAMNVCCFPTRTLGPQILTEILRGGLDSIKAAGALLAGGHTVEDQEPKYGLAVTGQVDEKTMLTKEGARPGQKLILSKPIGTGVLTTAHKKQAASEEHLAEAIAWMEKLNAEASQLLVAGGVRAATDVTGYGLLGHLYEMARSGRVTFELEAESVPLLAGALDYYHEGHFPGGSRANRNWLEGAGVVSWNDVSEPLRDLLNDAQTSGGLVAAWPPDQTVPQGFWEIGKVRAQGDVFLEIR